jgi:hypothetical protein
LAFNWSQRLLTHGGLFIEAAGSFNQRRRPRDEPLVNDVRPYNNTAYNITSLTLQIVGSAVEPVPFTFTFTLDPT